MSMESVVKGHARLWTVIAGLLFFAALVMAAAWAQEQAVPAPTASQRRAVGLLRLLNNTEYKYRSQFQRFGTLNELLDSRIAQVVMDEMREGAKRHPGFQFSTDLTSSDPAPGYSLAVFVSPEGPRYLASLKDNSADACAPSFYTDDSGVILQARAIGCK